MTNPNRLEEEKEWDEFESNIDYTLEDGITWSVYRAGDDMKHIFIKALRQARLSGIEAAQGVLPGEITEDKLPYENSPEIYGNQRLEAYKKGFNACLSTIRESLEKLKKEIR